MYNVRGCYVSDSDGLISIYFSYLKQGTNHRTCGKHILYLKCVFLNYIKWPLLSWLDHTYLKVYYVPIWYWHSRCSLMLDMTMPTQQTVAIFKAQMIGLTRHHWTKVHTIKRSLPIKFGRRRFDIGKLFKNTFISWPRNCVLLLHTHHWKYQLAKKKNFQYHLSGVVVDLLEVHFLPMGN